MTLLEHLHRLQRLRTEGLPPFLRNVCLITSALRLPELPEILNAHPQIKPRVIALLDEASPQGRHTMRLHGRDEHIPLIDPAHLPAYPNLDFVYYAHPDDAHGAGINFLSRSLAPYGIRNFHIIPSPQARHNYSSILAPSFFADNMAALEEVYRALADDASREVYAARVKAIVTGDAGFMPMSAHPEYHHPLVRPRAGDIMVDGGVSDMVAAQEQFAADVGPDGHIFGFEPMPYMYEAASEALRKLPQYRLFCLGLGAEKARVRFADDHDGSHVADQAENGVECEMTDLDSFLAEQKIRRLDCLKLDVEGSELAALKGAEKSIRKFRPRLIICLYHKIEDLIEIPGFVKALVPEYELYVSHSTLGMLDTVLFARVPEQKGPHKSA